MLAIGLFCLGSALFVGLSTAVAQGDAAPPGPSGQRTSSRSATTAEGVQLRSQDGCKRIWIDDDTDVLQAADRSWAYRLPPDAEFQCSGNLVSVALRPDVQLFIVGAEASQAAPDPDELSRQFYQQVAHRLDGYGADVEHEEPRRVTFAGYSEVAGSPEPLVCGESSYGQGSTRRVFYHCVGYRNAPDASHHLLGATWSVGPNVLSAPRVEWSGTLAKPVFDAWMVTDPRSSTETPLSALPSEGLRLSEASDSESSENEHWSGTGKTDFVQYEPADPESEERSERERQHTVSGILSIGGMFGGDWLYSVWWDDGKRESLRVASGLFVDVGLLGTLLEKRGHALDLEWTFGFTRQTIGLKGADNGWALGRTVSTYILPGYRATFGRRRRMHVKTSVGVQSAFVSRYETGGDLSGWEDFDHFELDPAWGPSVQFELIAWGASLAFRYNHIKFKDSPFGGTLDGSTVGLLVRGYFGRMMFQGERRKN